MCSGQRRRRRTGRRAGRTRTRWPRPQDRGAPGVVLQRSAARSRRPASRAGRRGRARSAACSRSEEVLGLTELLLDVVLQALELGFGDRQVFELLGGESVVLGEQGRARNDVPQRRSLPFDSCESDAEEARNCSGLEEVKNCTVGSMPPKRYVADANALRFWRPRRRGLLGAGALLRALASRLHVVEPQPGVVVALCGDRRFLVERIDLGLDLLNGRRRIPLPTPGSDHHGGDRRCRWRAGCARRYERPVGTKPALLLPRPLSREAPGWGEEVSPSATSTDVPEVMAVGFRWQAPSSATGWSGNATPSSGLNDLQRAPGAGI